MDNENLQVDGQTEITRFLEKFNQTTPVTEFSFSRPTAVREDAATAAKQEQYNQSFEKLEEKIRELEDKFQVGDEIEVKVKSFDKAEGKIALEYPLKPENPWFTLVNKYKINDRK